MDPKAVLGHAEDRLTEGNVLLCLMALADYRRWRERGGFEPEGGDSTYRRLADRTGLGIVDIRPSSVS